MLAHAPTASMTRINSGVVVELFEGGWVELGEGLSPVRVMVARHPAPAAGQEIPVGKRVGEWVYELYVTTLGSDNFLVEDVLDLYHGRGAFEGVLADEDVEEDPDRWCSYTECGQELWQIACQPCPFRDGCGTCAFPWDRRCRESSSATSSGPLPKKPLRPSELQTPHRKSTARGSGPPHSDEPRAGSGPRTSSCKRTASCAAQPEPVCG